MVCGKIKRVLPSSGASFGQTTLPKKPASAKKTTLLFFISPLPERVKNLLRQEPNPCTTRAPEVRYIWYGLGLRTWIEGYCPAGAGGLKDILVFQQRSCSCRSISVLLKNIGLTGQVKPCSRWSIPTVCKNPSSRRETFDLDKQPCFFLSISGHGEKPLLRQEHFVHNTNLYTTCAPDAALSFDGAVVGTWK